MSTIAENLTKLAEDRDNIATAISGKGVTVPEGSKLSEFPEMIEGISTGGSPDWADGWTIMSSNLPFICNYGSQAVELNDEIHTLGCTPDYNYTTSHHKFNGSSWVSVSTLPYAFMYGSAVVLNGEIHILGGSSSGTKLHYKWNGSSWVSVSTLPYDFFCGSAVVLDGEIHILGSKYYSSSYRYAKSHYKFNGSSWRYVSTLPYDFVEGYAVVYNEEIHILGGSINRQNHYKFNGSSWVSVSTLPYDVTKSTADCSVNNGLIKLLWGSASRKFDGLEWKNDAITPFDFTGSACLTFNDYFVILGSSSSATMTKWICRK